MKKFLLNSLFALIAMVGAFSWSVNANAALRGDLTGDGVVNVGDVSSLYEAIVSGNTDLKFDVNGDGQVNAGDVSELYDIILHGGGEEFGKVYILGNVAGDWDPTIGQEMTTSDGVTYTAKMEAVNLDGYSYFSFTKMLAETNDQAGWDMIADYRFGAVSEGDFLVTDEQLGQELALTAEGYQTFKIPTGTYNLTVNVEDMTLVIEKEAVVIDKLWMLGDMVEGGWAPNKGNEMTYDAAKGTFSTSFTAEGVQYFSFTSKLAEKEGEEGWAEIAASRFGAVTEDGTDFWVTAEQLDKELALQAGSTAFRVEAGTYTVTVDLAKMNVVISGEIAPEPIADLYLISDAGQGWDLTKGVKLTYDEAKAVYTGELKAEGDVYFSFTKKLATAADGWDEI
ncbi:MAG: dockerin type I repeat-containing protein, partial [Muribaculaceae bacterium]|nr:dockerin type I repeat-containing protein [Muribaculaceae bacterium]